MRCFKAKVSPPAPPSKAPKPQPVRLPRPSWNLAEDSAPPCLPWHTLQAQDVPPGTLQTSQGRPEHETGPAFQEVCSGLLSPSSGLTRPWEAAGTQRRLAFQGWGAGFTGLCCGFTWQGGGWQRHGLCEHSLTPPACSASLPPFLPLQGPRVVLRGGDRKRL